MARRSHYPAKPAKRNWADEEEKREVTAALSVLPPGHPARVAWELEDRTTVEVSRMLEERPDLAKALADAHWKGICRQAGPPSFYPVRGGLDASLLWPENSKVQPAFECPICGHNEYDQVWIKDRNGVERKTGAFECKKCSTMFREPGRFTKLRSMVEK